MKSRSVFFDLVRAGLWEKEIRLSSYGKIDFLELQRLSEEQSVVGLVAASLEHVVDAKVPKEHFLQFVGQAIMIEERNKAMNLFIAELVEKMRKVGIYTLLIKGQGVAQCYERPLWRSSGDIDFFCSEENFLKAREFFRPLIVDGFKPNHEKARNIYAQLPPWDIELHANQFCGLSKRIDEGIKEVQDCIFFEGQVRSWMNGNTQVFLPEANCDVILVFTHCIKHFYKGGLGLRQVCDWCRLLWTYRDKIDVRKLERRLQRMRLMSEWKVFGAFAVKYLGMPVEAMPLYDSSSKWTSKADRVCSFIMKVGNMGHSRDNSYYTKYPYAIRKACSLGHRISDLIRHARIFPLDSLRFLPNIVFHGVRSAVRGE